jgi:glycosyltransferase involved in cell wall biosynthesis
MKVLLLAPPLGSAGGIQRYTATLVRALKDLLGGQCVRCVAIPEVRDGSRHGRFSMRLKLRFGCEALLEAVRWRPDLTICTHLGLGPIGWLLANLGRRPYWIVVHGFEAWGLLPYWKRMGLRQADRVIVTSAFSREQVAKRHQIGSERISSLPCTLDERLTTVEPARNGLHRSLSDGSRVVLTVARMAASERYKGHDVVLRAMASVVAKIPNLTYVVVGGGDDRVRLKALTDELGLREHVAFTGEVSDSELAALYRRSEVFVLPARTVLDDRNPQGEGFGIVFLEAMAFGKPVIGPRYGAPAELIRHGENGLLVDPEDPASAAKALLDLLTHPDVAREMGKTGSDWVRRHYSYGSFREKLRQMLDDQVEGSQPVRASVKGLRAVTAGTLLEVVFVLWVVIVNVLYYTQFKDLFISRLARFVYRWR